MFKKPLVSREYGIYRPQTVSYIVYNMPFVADIKSQELRDKLNEHLSLEELRTLCFALGIDEENLQRHIKRVFIEELIVYLGWHHRVDQLINRLKEEYDFVAWPTADWDRVPWPNPDQPPPTLHPREIRNRNILINNIKQFWLDGYLDHALHNAVPLELGLAYESEAIDRQWNMVFQTQGKPSQEIPAGTSITDVYYSRGDSLLVLGEPGAGKTITLLELTRDLLRAAQQDYTFPIPVVFNLSSWAQQQPPLEDWLVDELNLQYQITRKVAAQWIEEDILMYMLDGLDEVQLEHRESCITAINGFREEHMSEMVVCSRTADYEILETKLRLRDAVLIQPLTASQINQYLNTHSSSATVINSILDEDTELADLARSPLMLNIMALTFQESPSLASEGTDKDSKQQLLFQNYVHSMFKRRSLQGSYTAADSLKWLQWLAQKMQTNAQSIFFIDRAQPSWLSSTEQTQYAALVGTLISLIVFLLIDPDYFTPPQWMIPPIITRLLLSLFIGGLLGWHSYRGEVTIAPVIQWGLNYEILKTALKKGLRAGFIIGLLPLGFIVITFILRGEFDPVIFSLLGLGIGFALAVAIVGALISLPRALIESVPVEHVEAEQELKPNQGIQRSIRQAILSALGVWAFLFGATYLFNILYINYYQPLFIFPESLAEAERIRADLVRFGFAFARSLALLVGLLAGGYTAIQHFALRVILTRNNHLPWRLTPFLQDMTNHLMMRRVGGGFIFIHRLLLDYFANNSLEVKPNES